MKKKNKDSRVSILIARGGNVARILALDVTF